MRLPNFLIIGAPKSGTTSLWSYLNQHPEIYLSPVKEPNYFALVGERLPDGGPSSPDVIKDLIHRSSITDYRAYISLFDGASGQHAVGEASVRYLYYAKAAQRIRDAIPDVRLVAILREPVGRLYSHYWMNVQFQLEPLTLLDALEAEDDRVAAGWGWDWHYVRISSYASQIQRYFQLFDREQIKIFLYEDFVKNPLQTFRETCRHLGVDDSFIPNMTKRAKVTTQPRNLTLDRWLNWPNRSRERLVRTLPRRVSRVLLNGLRTINSAPIPKLDPTIRRDLQLRFREDTAELEALLNRKTGW